MKKIVLISDGQKFPKKVFEFIRSMYEKDQFLLIGAFFHAAYSGLAIPNTFLPGEEHYLRFTKEEYDLYCETIDDFETLCCVHNIEHRVHKESNEWKIGDLIKESRFADMLVVSGQLFFSDVEEDQPNRFLRDVLCRAECPVLVVPEDVQPVKKVAVAYDGRKDSMFAIKMFCDVFPGFTSLPTEIYYWVNKTDDEIPDLDYLQEFASRHFSDVNLRELFFDASEYLAEWTNGKQDTMFVCGSYHRSRLSKWFRKSFAEDILKKHAAPLFIAHPG